MILLSVEIIIIIYLVDAHTGSITNKSYVNVCVCLEKKAVLIILLFILPGVFDISVVCVCFFRMKG